MTETLQEAIHLIRQGKKQEARAALEGLLRSNPKDAANWFWYAETLETPEQRVKVLELCLKANPGNPQVEKALAILREKIAPATPPLPSPPLPSRPAFDWDALEAGQQRRAGGGAPEFSWDDQPEMPPRAVVWDEVAPPENSPGGIRWDDDEPQAAVSSGIDWDAIEKAQAPVQAAPVVMADKPPAVKRAQPSYPFYEVWLKALTFTSQREYRSLLRDPKAGQLRAYEWMAYLGLFSGLLLPLLFWGLFNAFSMDFPLVTASAAVMVLLFAASAIVSCVLAVLGLIISAGVQFLIAGFLGGRGTFTHTVYALAAYLAPYTLISTLIAVIPLVQYLSPLLAIYGLALNARALKAAHEISTLRALAVIFLPSLLWLLFGCLIFFLVLPGFGEALMLP